MMRQNSGGLPCWHSSSQGWVQYISPHSSLLRFCSVAQEFILNVLHCLFQVFNSKSIYNKAKLNGIGWCSQSLHKFALCASIFWISLVVSPTFLFLSWLIPFILYHFFFWHILHFEIFWYVIYFELEMFISFAWDVWLKVFDIHHHKLCLWCEYDAID